MEKFKTQKVFVPVSPIEIPIDITLEGMTIDGVELKYVDRIVLTPEELIEVVNLAFNKGVRARSENKSIESVNIEREEFLEEIGWEETLFPTEIAERDNHHE